MAVRFIRRHTNIHQHTHTRGMPTCVDFSSWFFVSTWLVTILCDARNTNTKTLVVAMCLPCACVSVFDVLCMPVDLCSFSKRWLRLGGGTRFGLIWRWFKSCRLLSPVFFPGRTELTTLFYIHTYFDNVYALPKPTHSPAPPTHTYPPTHTHF